MITYNSMIGEEQVHTFTAFASDLYDDCPDLKKGFPRTIETTIGNKKPLIATTKKIDADGDIQYVRYIQACGIISLKIFNT